MGSKDKPIIRVSEEVKHFLDIQATKKGETYDQILRHLLTKLGARFSGGAEGEGE